MRGKKKNVTCVPCSIRALFISLISTRHTVSYADVSESITRNNFIVEHLWKRITGPRKTSRSLCSGICLHLVTITQLSPRMKLISRLLTTGHKGSATPTTEADESNKNKDECDAVARARKCCYLALTLLENRTNSLSPQVFLFTVEFSVRFSRALYLIRRKV